MPLLTERKDVNYILNSVDTVVEFITTNAYLSAVGDIGIRAESLLERELLRLLKPEAE